MTEAIAQSSGAVRRMSIAAVPERRRRVSEACRELEPATPFGFYQLPAGEPTTSTTIKDDVIRADRPAPPPLAAPLRLPSSTADRPDQGPPVASATHAADATSAKSHSTPEAAAAVVEADGIIVCLDKPVGTLLHGFDTRVRPFSRRSLLPVAADALGGELTKALAVLHRSPSPAVLQLRQAIEPTDDRPGFMVCDPLYGDLRSIKAPLTASQVRALFRSMLRAVAHCHAAGVAVGKFGLDSFCWADPGHTRLVLAGLGSARYLGAAASDCALRQTAAEESIAADVKGLGETFVHVITHYVERKARQPSELSVMLCRLLSAMVTTDPRSRPTLQALLDAPEFWCAPAHGAGVAPAPAPSPTEAEQVVPSWDAAPKPTACHAVSRKRSVARAGSKPLKRPKREVPRE